jgi:hypothetical protein
MSDSLNGYMGHPLIAQIRKLRNEPNAWASLSIFIHFRAERRWDSRSSSFYETNPCARRASLRFQVSGSKLEPRWKITKRTQPFMYCRFEIPDLRAGEPRMDTNSHERKNTERTQWQIRIENHKDTKGTKRDELAGQIFFCQTNPLRPSCSLCLRGSTKLPNEPIVGGSLPRNGHVIRCFRKPD